MVIKYNEQVKNISKTVRTFEVLSKAQVVFSIRGNQPPVVSFTAVSGRVEDAGNPEVLESRLLEQRLTNNTKDAVFPLLDSEGNETGRTMTFEEYFNATQSAYIALAKFKDR